MQSKYTATTQQLHSSRAWRSAGPKWRRPPHPQPHLHPHPTPSRWRSSSRSSSASAASRAVWAPRRQPRAACRPSACLSRARPSRRWAACFRGPARDFPRRLAATRRALERPCVPKIRSCVLRARLGEQGPGRGRASPGVWGARWVTNAWSHANNVYRCVYSRVRARVLCSGPCAVSFFARGPRPSGIITLHGSVEWGPVRHCESRHPWPPPRAPRELRVIVPRSGTPADLAFFPETFVMIPSSLIFIPKLVGGASFSIV